MHEQPDDSKERRSKDSDTPRRPEEVCRISLVSMEWSGTVGLILKTLSPQLSLASTENKIKSLWMKDKIKDLLLDSCGFSPSENTASLLPERFCL